jgi:hypothetical protein
MRDYSMETMDLFAYNADMALDDIWKMLGYQGGTWASPREVEQAVLNWMHMRRKNFEETLADGTVCETCGRWAHLDKRRINRTMLRALTWLYTEFGGEWVHVPTAFREAGEYDLSKQYSTLRWWGLIEPRPHPKNPKHHQSGVWRVTRRGQQFLHGRVEVPEFVWTYNGEVRDTSKGRVLVHEVDKDFDIREVLGR